MENLYKKVKNILRALESGLTEQPKMHIKKGKKSYIISECLEGVCEEFYFEMEFTLDNKVICSFTPPSYFSNLYDMERINSFEFFCNKINLIYNNSDKDFTFTKMLVFTDETEDDKEHLIQSTYTNFKKYIFEMLQQTKRQKNKINYSSILFNEIVDVFHDEVEPVWVTKNAISLSGKESKKNNADYVSYINVDMELDEETQSNLSVTFQYREIENFYESRKIYKKIREELPESDIFFIYNEDIYSCKIIEEMHFKLLHNNFKNIAKTIKVKYLKFKELIKKN